MTHSDLYAGRHERRRRSLYLQVLGRGLAAIADDLVFDLLAFIERPDPGALYGRNVNEHVLTTALRLDKAVALGCIEPLHGTGRHHNLLESRTIASRRTVHLILCSSAAATIIGWGASARPRVATSSSALSTRRARPRPRRLGNHDLE